MNCVDEQISCDSGGDVVAELLLSAAAVMLLGFTTETTGSVLLSAVDVDGVVLDTNETVGGVELMSTDML